MIPRINSGTFAKLALELVLVSVAVFLGLLADEWREGRQHREAALSSLRQVRSEVLSNHKALESQRQYHTTLAKEIGAYLSSSKPPDVSAFNQQVHFSGVHPVLLEHTAWDLALVTQALSYMAPDLAYRISRVYTGQQSFQTLQTNFMQAAFGPQSFVNDAAVIGTVRAMQVYFADVNIQEAQLMKAYDNLTPLIDVALGDASR